VQLVQALRYKPESHGFDSRLLHWNFLFTILRTALWSWDRLNQEYFLGGKGGRCVRLTTVPPSCTDYHEMCQPQTSGTLRTCPDPYRDSWTSFLNSSKRHAYSCTDCLVFNYTTLSSTKYYIILVIYSILLMNSPSLKTTKSDIYRIEKVWHC